MTHPVFVWRACVMLCYIIDCFLFMTCGIVTGVRWACMLVVMNNEHVWASNWVGFSSNLSYYNQNARVG